MGLKDHAEALLKEAKMGLTRPYIELCKIYYNKVFHLILQFHADVMHAEYLTIEVFVKGWKNLSKVKDEYNFLSWIQRIAIVVVLYHYKMEEEFKKKNLDEDESISLISSRNSLTPIETEFAGLSDRERIMLTLFCNLEFTVADIAPAIGETNINTENRIVELLSGLFKYSNKRLLKTHQLKTSSF